MTMPSFQYQFTPSNMANTIMQLMSSDPRAAGIIAAAEAQGKGAQGASQAWGQGLSNLQKQLSQIFGTTSTSPYAAAPLSQGNVTGNYGNVLSSVPAYSASPYDALSQGTVTGNYGNVISTIPDYYTAMLGY